MDIKKYIKTFDRYFQQNKLNSVRNICYFNIEEAIFSECRKLPSDINLIVTIPCYDDQEVFKALDSLAQNTTEEGLYYIFVLVNFSENLSLEIKERNINLYKTLVEYASKSPLFIKVFSAFDLPLKLSGVGVARKLLMDAAAYYYYINNRFNGIITSTDADTLFSKNYCDTIVNILRDDNVSGISINFEHRIEGVEACYREAITKYELYMRYYRMALLWCGHPYYYSCIGSAIATNAKDYVAQGGMSKKTAGEDFYFIQKLISTNRFTETSDTKVFPSARLSERTPFGTGRAIKEISENNDNYLVFSPYSFVILKDFFDKIVVLCKAISKDSSKNPSKKIGNSIAKKVAIDENISNNLYKGDDIGEERGKRIGKDTRLYGESDLYILSQVLYSDLHPYLRECTSLLDLNKIIFDAYRNTSSENKLIQRFFYNFNALKVLQCLNLMHKENIERVDVFDALNSFLYKFGNMSFSNVYDMLEYLRLNDRRLV